VALRLFASDILRLMNVMRLLNTDSVKFGLYVLVIEITIDSLCSRYQLCTATVQGVVLPSTDNVAWPGTTLRFRAVEDRAVYAINAVSAQSQKAFLTAVSGGVELSARIYVNKFLTFGRSNAQLVGIASRDKVFGLQVSDLLYERMMQIRHPQTHDVGFPAPCIFYSFNLAKKKQGERGRAMEGEWEGYARTP
jgi:hypothetical protein